MHYKCYNVKAKIYNYCINVKGNLVVNCNKVNDKFGHVRLSFGERGQRGGGWYWYLKMKYFPVY